jgi:hypothetical protein
MLKGARSPDGHLCPGVGKKNEAKVRVTERADAQGSFA